MPTQILIIKKYQLKLKSSENILYIYIYIKKSRKYLFFLPKKAKIEFLFYFFFSRKSELSWSCTETSLIRGVSELGIRVRVWEEKAVGL
jgi:hypothetical protein